MVDEEFAINSDNESVIDPKVANDDVGLYDSYDDNLLDEEELEKKPSAVKSPPVK